MKKFVAMILACLCLMTSVLAVDAAAFDGEVLGTDANVSGILLPDDPNEVMMFAGDNLLFSMRADVVKDMLPSRVGGKSFTKSSFSNGNLEVRGTLTDTASDAYTVKCGICTYSSSSGTYVDRTPNGYPYLLSGTYDSYSVSISNLNSSYTYYGFIKKNSTGSGYVYGNVSFYDSVD